MPGKVWSKRELRMMKYFYLEERLSIPEIAELIDGRSISQIRHKIYTLGWGKLRKARDELAKNVESDTLTSNNKTALAKQEGEALTEKFVDEVSIRAANATAIAFESFEHEANQEDIGDRNLHRMETAIKIADRTSNIARKALGLDGPDSPHAGKSIFNVYFAEEAEVKKVDSESENDTQEGTIDV